MAKPPNKTLGFSASKSVININYPIACIKSLHEFKKFYTVKVFIIMILVKAFFKFFDLRVHANAMIIARKSSQNTLLRSQS